MLTPLREKRGWRWSFVWYRNPVDFQHDRSCGEKPGRVSQTIGHKVWPLWDRPAGWSQRVDLYSFSLLADDSFFLEMSDCFYQSASYVCMTEFLRWDKLVIWAQVVVEADRRRAISVYISLGKKRKLTRHWTLNTTLRYFCVTLKIDIENIQARERTLYCSPKTITEKRKYLVQYLRSFIQKGHQYYRTKWFKQSWVSSTAPTQGRFSCVSLPIQGEAALCALRLE